MDVQAYLKLAESYYHQYVDKAGPLREKYQLRIGDENNDVTIAEVIQQAATVNSQLLYVDNAWQYYLSAVQYNLDHAEVARVKKLIMQEFEF
jgi:hypothetical protein